MKKEILKFLVLAMLAVGAGPVSAAVWQWSRTANSNATADPTINWAEGMSPSSVNDSARAQMARSAEWRDDISGFLVAGGTTTAMTLTTYASTGGNGLCPSAAAPIDGTMLAFRTNSGNGASPTIAIDSCTAKPLQMTYGTAMPAGTMTPGTTYRITYNGSAAAWVIEGLQNSPSAVPLGALIAFTGATSPNSNFILPAGQCISTTTYAAYWTIMGAPAPGACAGGQFQVIDLRGRVLAALDNLNGTAATRLTASGTGCGTSMTSVGTFCANGNQSITLSTVHVPAHTHSGTTNNVDRSLDHNHTVAAPQSKAATSGGGGAYLTIWNDGGAGSSTVTSSGITSAPASDGALSHLHTFTTDNGTGSAQAVPTVQPTIAVTYLLRVL